MHEQKTVANISEEFSTHLENGLSEEEAKQRLLKHGPNVFDEGKSKTKLQMFISQLKDPMIYILMVAVAISIFLGKVDDSLIIIAVILLNAIIGMVQENKAEKSLEALTQMSSPFALVKRDGQTREIPAADLVPGDLVVLEAGRVIPADLRLTSAINLKVEESALTGESVPVDKDAEFIVDGNVTLGDRLNMAYLSTSVSYGRGEGIVVETGMTTEIGKIAKLINETVEELTPLQKRLADLGKMLGIVAVILCGLLFAVALFQGRDIVDMLLTAISLAVAAIPEGLPAVVTIVLALGVQKMVKVNTIVRKLPAVETLGAVSIVCSDKTGTLTQNKMTVTKVYFDGELKDLSDVDYESGQFIFDGFILCTDATVQKNNRLGDPTELALIDLGLKFGITKEQLEDESPRFNEQAFDSDRKMMTTVHKDDGEIVSYTKGALDQILKNCISILENGKEIPITQAHKDKFMEASRQMSLEALRVLALAYEHGDDSADERGLTFAGLVGMIDPPRPEAKNAVEIFNGASISTVMITGDHIDTAFAIAKELNIAQSEDQCISGNELEPMSQEDLNAVVLDLRVFARVSPEHKVAIVKAFRSHGHIVSMTGDGVNDAPSLKVADIGVAMGITGTDVAKGAADMVLTDDNFATIQKAIEEGRNIYNNIKKSVIFLLSSNLGEVITMFVAIVAGLAAPLQAIHILWVNLVTDSLPGLALGMDTGNKDIMKEKPRNSKESLFANGGIVTIVCFGSLIGLTTLSAFLYAPVMALLNADMTVTLQGVKDMLTDTNLLMVSQTYAFIVLALSQLFNAIGMRNINKSIFRFNHFDNKMMMVAFAIGFILQVAVTEIGFMSNIFGTVSLSLTEWVALTVLATSPLWLHEIRVLFRYVMKK